MFRLVFVALCAALVAGCGGGPTPPSGSLPQPATHCRPATMGAAERCNQRVTAPRALSQPAGVAGIDLSNNDPSYGRWGLIRQHAAFAYFKVSEGTGFIDSTAARMASEARRAGLLVGGYDFQHVCGTSPVLEAQVFVAAARRARLLSGPGVLPPTADFELSYGSCNRSAWLAAWTRTVRREARVAVYSDPGFYTPSVGCFHGADVGWVADLGAYQPLCGLPTPLHQWSWSYWDGTGAVDGDVFRGTYTQLRALAHQAPKPLPRKQRLALVLADLHRHGCFHIHGKRAYRLCPYWGAEWRRLGGH